MNGHIIFIAPRVQPLVDFGAQVGYGLTDASNRAHFVLTHALDDLFHPTPLIFRGHHE